MKNDTSATAVAGDHALFNAMPSPLAVLDDSFFFLDVNPAFEEAFGYAAGDLRGKSSLSIYDATTLAQVRKDRLRIQEIACGRLACDRSVVSTSGRVKNALVRMATIGHRGGQASYLLLFEDVHEASEREKLLYSRAEMFRVTIDQSPVPICIQDQNFRLVLVNRAFCDFVGYEEHELLGLDPADFLHPAEARPKVRYYRDKVDASPAEGRPLISVVREAVHKDGRRIPYRLEYGPSRGIDGAPLWCCMLVDLSRQKEAQVELRAQVDYGNQLQNRFDTFATLTSDAVLVTDPESNRVIYANDAVLNVLGLEMPDATGQPVEQLWTAVEPADRDRIVKAIEQPPANGQTELLVQVNHEQVGPITVRMRLFSLGRANDECFILAEDVSETLHREQIRLDEAVRQRDIFVREIHHRIKNNLQGLTGLVSQYALQEPGLKGSLEKVAEQISAIADIHGLQFEQSQRVSPVHLIETVSKGLGRVFGVQSHFHVVGDLGPDTWIISESEVVPMALVVNELMTNAFKHAKDAEPLCVSVRESQGAIQMQIANPGDLPAGFAFERYRSSHRGLGLVNSLIPKQGLKVAIEQQDGLVLTRLVIAPPILSRSPGS